jgi:hypothetical protein
MQVLEREAGAGGAEARARDAAALEAEVARRRALLTAIRKATAIDDAGATVSSVLGTLAERHRDGLRLTRIIVRPVPA